MNDFDNSPGGLDGPPAPERRNAGALIGALLGAVLATGLVVLLIVVIAWSIAWLVGNFPTP